METLAISAANLNTIEKNLNAVANELSGVITNVSSVNSQVSKVEDQVNSLNSEFKNLIKEIRETTIITNARQSIMYNNEQIDKKFSYYNTVRRTTESLLDAIIDSSISRKTLYNLNQQLLINNPHYWLSNALAALSYWLQNDHTNCEKEVNNALKKDAKKTSLFFTYINLKLKRLNTSLNWLKKYLSSINPLELDKDFITVLDLLNSGLLGNAGRDLILNKINEWFIRLKNDQVVKERQERIWSNFISDNEETIVYMPYSESYIKEVDILKHNLVRTSSYHNILNHFNSIMNENLEPKDIDTIINNLIYDYESQEQTYELDNIRNNLIIACNGNTEEANRLFKKQELLYQDKVDLITVLSNLVIFNTEYKVSQSTRKIALSLVKDYIIDTFNKKNKDIIMSNINIEINNFKTTVNKDINHEQIKNDINNYVEKEYISDDKDLTIILFILNILGIIGIFITLNNKIFNHIIIVLLIIADTFLIYKLFNRNKIRQMAKEKVKSTISNTTETVLAELTDYYNIIEDDQKEFNKLTNYLASLNTSNYTSTNGERNIDIDTVGE